MSIYSYHFSWELWGRDSSPNSRMVQRSSFWISHQIHLTYYMQLWCAANTVHCSACGAKRRTRNTKTTLRCVTKKTDGKLSVCTRLHTKLAHACLQSMHTLAHKAGPTSTTWPKSMSLSSGCRPRGARLSIQQNHFFIHV